MAGKRDEARRVLSQVQSLSEREYFPSYFIALIHMGLGERDETLDWLEKSFEERAGYLIFLADPVFDSLRSDPRFADLVRRVGLQP